MITVVLALVITALATYASATLRFGRQVEASADRLAAAQGAMDNALEDIERGTSPCVTETVENGNSYSYQLATDINEIRPTVTCTVFDGDVTPIDAYAVIMTGAGGHTGPLLTATGAGGSDNGRKTFTGNVYMEAVPDVDDKIDLSTNLDIKDGQLNYHSDSDPTCTQAIDLGSHPKQITLSPGFTAACNPAVGWERFLQLQPIEPDVATFPTRDADTPSEITNSGCTVWMPGHYTDAPELGAANYFMSGEYFFDNIGSWNIASAWVLAGWPGIAGPSILTNKVKGNGSPDHSESVSDKCSDTWDEDSHTGAAFYLGGDSHIMIDQNASLEIAGFIRDGYNIGLYALENSGVSSELQGNDRIVQTGSGNKKQLAVHGLVWAPYTGLEFSNIANDVVAALTGGAVVSWLSAGAAANTNNFLVTVQTQPQVLSFIVTSTAVNGGSTTVRTQILYRTNGGTNEYAVLSRRVIDLTPE